MWYLQKFREFPKQIHEEYPFLNITMFGGVGVGKSSFLNTIVTALANDQNKVYKDFKAAPTKTGHSKTKTVCTLAIKSTRISMICPCYYNGNMSSITYTIICHTYKLKS